MIDPRGLTVTDWCDSMALELARMMSPQVLLSPERWREWAHTVIQVPSISKFVPPNPDQYEDWREWAIRFNQTVPL